jgi:hypothetical protein
MSTSRDFPFSFSAEARAVLGSPNALNLAVRSAFPELEAGWAGRTATYGCDSLFGPRGGHAGWLVQWECELYSGRPKARCYPFNLSGHRFRGNLKEPPGLSYHMILLHMTSYMISFMIRGA